MSGKAKAVTATIKLVINAGQAKPAPPVGPALGQAGLNIMSFCKDFNAKTADKKVSYLLAVSCSQLVACITLHCRSGEIAADMLCKLQSDIPVPVVITAYSDKTFTYVMKTPPVTYFIKQAANIKSGSQRPGHVAAAEISVRNIYDIAQQKQQDAPDMTLEAICRSVAGTCKSMGVKVVNA